MIRQLYDLQRSHPDNSGTHLALVHFFLTFITSKLF